jgi:hypothetical protein
MTLCAAIRAAHQAYAETIRCRAPKAAIEAVRRMLSEADAADAAALVRGAS